MTNAKQEFLDHVSTQHCQTGNRTIRCAILTSLSCERDGSYILPVGYTKEDQELFLKQIDFNYDAGFGGQELEGTIWYTDGLTWSSRGEYDGSEWWDFNIMPTITPELLGSPSTTT